MRRAPTSSAIREVTLVGLYLSIGILFRLWLASLAPQPFINDQFDYEWFAYKMFKDPLMIASHSFRSYAYPLVLALLYKLVGFGNHQAVFVFQAIVDSLTGVIVYLIIKRGFGNRHAARLGLALYELNPFTAGYVNVILSEIVTVFFLAMTILAGVLFASKPSVAKGLLLGFCAGMTGQTRNAVFAWMAIPFGLMLLWLPLVKHRVAYVALVIGFTITMLYPGYANWRTYREINITTVDSFYAKEFFNGAIIKRLPPLAPSLPQETHQMYAEYYSEYWPKRDSQYRREVAQKYFTKAWEIIRADPLDYIKTRFDKMWYVWQKEAVYVYSDPWFIQHKWMVFHLNLFLLSMALLGIILWGPHLGPILTTAGKWAWWTMVCTIIYGTISLSFSHAEQRLSIPFYPLLTIFAAAGGAKVVEFLTTKIVGYGSIRLPRL